MLADPRIPRSEVVRIDQRIEASYINLVDVMERAGSEIADLSCGRAVDQVDIHNWSDSDIVILAKGRVDFISDGQQWQRNSFGSPRLSVGGSDDILADLCARFNILREQQLPAV